MNRYETSMPRAALGAAAIAMSALTLAVAVLLPAYFAAERYDARALVASRVAAQLEIAIIPARIDVVTRCDHEQGVEQARQSAPSADRST